MLRLLPAGEAFLAPAVPAMSCPAGLGYPHRRTQGMPKVAIS